MKKIKTALIGAGFIGEAHIEAIRRLGFVDVVAIGLENEELALERARQLNIEKAYGDYGDLLNDPEIEVVHNCTPNHLHYELNRQILLHNKHLLSEKPLTLTSKEAEQLVKLAEKQQVVAAVNFNYRQFPMVQHLRGMVRENQLGEVRIVRGEYLQDWLFYETDYNWRLQPEYGGETRAIGDIGSHLFDLAQHVVGQKIVEVFCDMETFIKKRYMNHSNNSTYQANHSIPNEDSSSFDISTEDYAAILVKFEGGAKGVLNVSQISAGKKNALSIEIDGSKATGSWHQEEPFKLYLGYRDKANEVLTRNPSLANQYSSPFIHYPGGHEEGWADSLKNSMLNFYQAIRDGIPLGESVATIKDGYEIMLLIDAVVKSAKTGSWVKV